MMVGCSALQTGVWGHGDHDTLMGTARHGQGRLLLK